MIIMTGEIPHTQILCKHGEVYEVTQSQYSITTRWRCTLEQWWANIFYRWPHLKLYCLGLYTGWPKK